MSTGPHAFVVGHPIGHSRSPLIHGYWLRQHELSGSYERIDVSPAGFAAFIASLVSRGLVGGNVTIPHKQAALALADRVTDRARLLGAANTLWRANGLLYADNTDVQGFVDSLDASVPGWAGTGGHAVVLGAGGAARGIVAGLLDRIPERIVVVNRTPARAADLAAVFGPRVTAHAWADVATVLPRAGLLVNTTSLGMLGQPALAIDLAPLPAGALVADIVYVPLETPLLAAARRRGLQTVDGLGMLLHQAVPGFARWFGITPTVTPELRALVVADIEGHR